MPSKPFHLQCQTLCMKHKTLIRAQLKVYDATGNNIVIMTTDALSIYFCTILNFCPNALYSLMSLLFNKYLKLSMRNQPNPQNHKWGIEESYSLNMLPADCKPYPDGDHIKDTCRVSLSPAHRNSSRSLQNNENRSSPSSKSFLATATCSFLT